MKPDISMIGVPIALGANRFGADLGPKAIRFAGLERRLAQLGCAVREESVPEKPAWPWN
jgi:arginase